MKSHKVKAGALQFTMFVVVIIALLLVSFIILVHTKKQFKIQTGFVIETTNNAQKGIEYALKNDIRINDTVSVDLLDENYKALSVHKSYWGIFEKVLSTSKIKNNTIKKMGLLGASQPDNDRVALYLEEHNRPLVVVGKTKIEGVAYLPKQGVRTGNISGNSYYGSQLIYGKTKLSHSLPKLLQETLNHIKNTNISTIHPDQFLDLNQKRTHQNSFFNPLQVIYSTTNINLSETALTGHILIQSKTKITVDSSSKLKDVVLMAPEIDIKNHVKGTFQAIATKTITVGKNCVLNYPTALILNDKNALIENNTIQKKEERGIHINANSKIKGVVTYFGVSTSNRFEPQIVIDQNATIIGEIYCTKNLELKGNVYGCVLTSSFVAKQSGSIYQNHIYNGKITVSDLPNEYIGLPFENSKKGVAKWLY